jgi:F-type H+-transporting ATPase subunit b
MHLSGWTLAFQAINFLVLAWMLQRFLYKPVLAALDRRRAETERVIKEANDSKEAANTLRRDLEHQRDGLAAERARIVEAALADGEKERQRVLAEAGVEKDHLLAQAQESLQRAEGAARARIESEAAGVAVELARRLLSVVPPRAVSTALLEDVLAELDAMTAAERERLTGARAGRAEVTIVLPEALTPSDLEVAQRRLASALGGSPVVSVRVDPALVAGVEVRFPYAILHRNWRDGLQAAQVRLAAV